VTTDATERLLTLPLLAARRRFVSERQEISSRLHSDEDLLNRLHQRDDDALLSLFHRYSSLAYGIACRILHDKGEAEDLVQELFLHLHTRENSFDPGKGTGRTWLVQMFYRRAFDRRAYLHRRHFYNGTDFGEYANTLLQEGSLERDLIEHLTAQQLRSAFSELSDKQRQTLEMFFFEGLKLSEIAERSGEDIQNVRHHYYRGLERLRQITRAMARGGKSGS
jgi:RNA polymerase sigma-70 factor (ECF subfamily)